MTCISENSKTAKDFLRIIRSEFVDMCRLLALRMPINCEVFLYLDQGNATEKRSVFVLFHIYPRKIPTQTVSDHVLLFFHLDQGLFREFLFS